MLDNCILYKSRQKVERRLGENKMLGDDNAEQRHMTMWKQGVFYVSGLDIANKCNGTIATRMCF